MTDLESEVVAEGSESRKCMQIPKKPNLPHMKGSLPSMPSIASMGSRRTDVSLGFSQFDFNMILYFTKNLECNFE